MIIPKNDILKAIVYDYLELVDVAVFDASITCHALRASLGLQQCSIQYLTESSLSEYPYPFELNPYTYVEVSFEAMLLWCWRRRFRITSMILILEYLYDTSPNSAMDTILCCRSLFQSVKLFICNVDIEIPDFGAVLIPELRSLESLIWFNIPRDCFDQLLLTLENDPAISQSLKTFSIGYHFPYDYFNDERMTRFILSTPNMESCKLIGKGYSPSIISLIAHSWPNLNEFNVTIYSDCGVNDYEAFREWKISLRVLDLILYDEIVPQTLPCLTSLLSNSSISLVHLDIRGRGIEEEDLCKILRPLVNLRQLSYIALDYSNSLMLTLSDSCHDLRVLDLYGDSTVDDEGIRALTMGCPKIESLRLANCQFSKDSVERIANSYRNTLKLIQLMYVSHIYAEQCHEIFCKVLGENVVRLSVHWI